MKVSYYLRVFSGVRSQKLLEALRLSHERSGRSRISILLDMAYCAFRFGAGYYDYLSFGFYGLTNAQRDTYLTRFRSRALNDAVNSPAEAARIDNKAAAYRLFSDFIHREWLDLHDASKEDVLRFLEGKTEIFLKPAGGSCGEGSRRLRLEDFPDREGLVRHIMSGKYDLLEEVIRQHPLLEKLHPGSVNCLRLITLLDDDGVPRLLYMVQKAGIGDKWIDNNSCYSPVEPKTGVLLYPAHSGTTRLGKVYETHPDSGIRFEGYHIPYVPEAVNMVKKAALVVPGVRYIGWDVAITPEGPELVEANSYNAHDFWQVPAHTPGKTGVYPTICSYVGALRPAKRGLLRSIRCRIFRLQHIPENVRYCLVFGAGIYHGERMSDILLLRMKTVKLIYKKRPDTVFILSGCEEDTDAMADYLMKKSTIPKEQIIIDCKGTSSFYSVRNTKKRLGCRPVMLLTSSFHLPRCIYLANGIGLNAYGIDMRPYEKKFSYLYIPRECAAFVKAFIMIKRFRRDGGKD